jgi:hypothetical protein
MKNLSVFVMVFLGLTAVSEVFGQQVWMLQKDESGVQVYTKSTQGSDFKTVKTVCTLQTTLTRMAAILLDVMRTPEWVYGTQSCKMLKQESPSSVFYYAEMGMPWPVKNRDFIIRISVVQDPLTKIVTVKAENKPDYIPEKKGNIRILISSGNWTITPLTKGQLRVQYELHVDPGGQLPASIVNMFMYDGPYETFKKLPSRVSMNEYENQRFSFIRD